VTIATSLPIAFKTESTAARGEVALFQSLIRALNSLGQDGLAKEYHGNRFQVTFKQARGAGRSNPRCELCDVLIIQYPAGNPGLARLTFNQAKVTKKQLGCGVLTPYKFAGNLEQWDLLANRPLISPATKTFDPPTNLLRDALLPSVGSFGVFYPSGGLHDFAYFAADLLRPVNNRHGRSGVLEWKRPPGHVRRHSSGYLEVTEACCIWTFSKYLALGLVGTPVHQLISQSTEPGGFTRWFLGVLNNLQQEFPESALPGELMYGLDLMVSHDEGALSSETGRPAIRAVAIVRTSGEVMG